MTKIMKPIKFNNNDQLPNNALRPYKSKRKEECTIPVVSGSLPLAEDIQKRLIDFFKLEADLEFCKREYYERVKWYFETYQDELFGLH